MNVDRCLTVTELSKRWRCRVTKIREMVRRGTLAAINVGKRGVRITPEVIREAEQKTLAVKPKTRRRREYVDPAIAAILTEG